MRLNTIIRKKLVFKFITTLLPVIVMGFAVLTYVITSNAISSLNSVVEHKIDGASSLIKKSIESWLTQNSQLMTGLSKQPSLAATLDNTEASDTQNRYLESLKQIYQFRNIALLDAQGKAILSGNPKRLGKNYGSFNYFKQALNSTQVIIDDPRLSRVDKSPLLTLAVKVTSPQGNQGVLFASLPLTQLYENLVNSQNSDPESFAFVLTNNCQPLIHPNSKIILSDQAQAQQKYQLFCNQDNAIQEFSEGDIRYMAKSVQIPLTEWRLVSSIQKSAITSITSALTQTSTLFGIAISAVFTVILILLFKPISQALSDISKAIYRIAKGDVNFEPAAQQKCQELGMREDELGRIGQSLQQLIDNQQRQSSSAVSIANGELDCDTHVASDKDQLGNAIVQMSDKLKEVITTLYHSAEQILTTTQLAQQQSESLSVGAEQQTQAIDSVSAALHEMETQTQLTHRVSQDIAAQAKSSSSEAHLGKSKMHDLSNAIASLHVSGQKISEIMQNITSIASQTNLIALNAAIEAARAGEHGRGFAVVASEIRDLAGLTTQAAENSNALVKEILSHMESGISLSSEAESSFNLIVEHVDNSAQELNNFLLAHEEQSSATSHLRNALQQIEQAANANLDIAQGSKAQGEELSAMAEQLVGAAQYFSFKK